MSPSAFGLNDNGEMGSGRASQPLDLGQRSPINLSNSARVASYSAFLIILDTLLRFQILPSFQTSQILARVALQCNRRVLTQPNIGPLGPDKIFAPCGSKRSIVWDFQAGRGGQALATGAPNRSHCYNFGEQQKRPIWPNSGQGSPQCDRAFTFGKCICLKNCQGFCLKSALNNGIILGILRYCLVRGGWPNSKDVIPYDGDIM